MENRTRYYVERVIGFGYHYYYYYYHYDGHVTAVLSSGNLRPPKN
jgi:hypothetical protein